MNESTLTISGVRDASFVYELANRMQALYDEVPGETHVQVRKLTPQAILILCDYPNFFRKEGVMIVVAVTHSDLDACRVQVFSGGGQTGDLDDLILNPRKRAVKQVAALIKNLCKDRRLEITE